MNMQVFIDLCQSLGLICLSVALITSQRNR